MVILAILLQSIATVAIMLEPYVIGRALNTVQQADSYNSDVFNTLVTYLLILVGITIFFWSLWGIARVIESINSFHISNNFKLEMLDIVLHVPLFWHQENHSGKSIDKIGRASYALKEYSSSLFEIIGAIIKLMVAFTALFLIDFFSGGIALSVSIFAIIAIVLIDRIITKLLKRIYNYENKTASAVHDFVTNITTVISLKLQRYALLEIKKRIAKPFEIFKKEKIINEAKWAGADHLVQIMTVAVLIIFAYGVLRRGEILLIGTFAMIYQYLKQVGDVFYTTAWRYSTIVGEHAMITSADNIKNAAKYRIKELPKKEKVQKWQKIDLKGLYFSYKKPLKKEGGKAGLFGIDLSLKKGEKIALVGTSGSGKSTILAVLKGLYQAEKGKIIVDGQENKNGLRAISDQIALVPQDPEIFQSTVKFNIALGGKFSEQEIEEVIAISHFDEVLKRLRKDTSLNIAEKGVSLSGGEKQRLALARGLLFAKDQSILCLDEPTSSVDPQIERSIFEDLFKEFSDKTILASVHRLHLLPYFSKIYLFEHGRVVGSGTFDELREKNKYFRHIWKSYQEAENDEALDFA